MTIAWLQLSHVWHSVVPVPACFTVSEMGIEILRHLAAVHPLSLDIDIGKC